MPSVLVTGAARGIGAATVRRLAGAGWDVLAGVRRPEDAEPLVAEHPQSVTGTAFRGVSDDRAQGRLKAWRALSARARASQPYR
jgi:NAD(P)-dependent dehydrogenase (short-subunit alcohol dehydrogenase family)